MSIWCATFAKFYGDWATLTNEYEVSRIKYQQTLYTLFRKDPSYAKIVEIAEMSPRMLLWTYNFMLYDSNPRGTCVNLSRRLRQFQLQELFEWFGNGKYSEILQWN